MNNDQRAVLRNRIIAELEQHQQDIEHLEEATRPVAPDNAIGRLTRMEAINEKNVNEVALKAARDKVKKLKVALENIDDEDFGYCHVCGEAIPFARLELMPEATECVKCAESGGD
jgi:DnaK suppressor protein